MTRDLPTLSQAHRELEAHDDAHELVLYAENTGELYSEKKKLERFLSLQWKRNGYKPTAALVAWRLFAKRAAKRYEREIKGSHFHVERGINVAAAYWEAALRDELMRESRKTMNDPRRSSRDKRRRSLRERIAARNEQNKRIGAHVYRHPMDHTAGMGDRRFENPQRGFAVQSFEFKTVSDGRYVAAFQVHLPGGRKTAEGWTGPELLESPSRCLEAALRILRLSLRRCAHLPAEERLSFYARGRCESEQGRRISWDRFRLQRYAFSP